MKAILRAGTMSVAMALAVAPAAALAQSASTPAPTSNSIGPSELQNFNLKGTVTRQADQPAVATPARPQTAPVRPPVLPRLPPRPAPARTATSTTSPAPSIAARPPPATRSPTPVPPTAAPPPVEIAPSVRAPVPAPASVTPAPAEDTIARPDYSAPLRGLPLWPWIAAALALAAGAGVLLWRRWPRQELAGAQFDLLAPVPRETEPPAPPT